MKCTSDAAIFMSVLCVSKRFLAFNWTEDLLLLEWDQLLCCCLPSTANRRDPSILCAASDLAGSCSGCQAAPGGEGVSGWEAELHVSIAHGVRDAHRCVQDLPRAMVAISQSKGFDVTHQFTPTPSLPFLYVGDSRGYFHVGSCFFLISYLYFQIVWLLTGLLKVYLAKVYTSADLKIQFLCKS